MTCFIPRVIFILFAFALFACRSEYENSISVQLTYPDSASAAYRAVADTENQTASQNSVYASYAINPSNRILIRVISPDFGPIEAWFERSEGRGVIRNVPPGGRISVEVDEYDSSAAVLGTDAVLLGRGWTRGITLSPGEAKTVNVAMYAKGTILTICGREGDSGDGGLSHDAKIRNPSAVKVGPDDSIYFSSFGNRKVKRIDRYGYVSNFAGNGGIGLVGVFGTDASFVPIDSVSDIDIEPAGNVYLFTYSNQIVKVSSSGIIQDVVYDNGVIDHVGGPWFNLAVVSNGMLYFVNYSDKRVYQIFDSVKSDAVRDDTPHSLAEPIDRFNYPISNPSGITYASSSNSLIFTDTNNNRIMELSFIDSKIRYLVAGSGYFSEGVAPLSMEPIKPRVVDYNPITGKIFFVEEGENRVLYITADNVVRTFAGTGTASFSGDGGPATEAQLYDPRGITVDSRGNAYIADFGNHAIRVVVGGALP